MNNGDTKRETLADRAAKPSGIVPPSASKINSGIAKPTARSNSTTPSTNRAPQYPRPKSSLERVRPGSTSFSSLNSMSRSTSSSRPNSMYGGSRPPSAQELRSAIDDELAVSGDDKQKLEWERRLAELEAAFRQVREEKKSSSVDGDAYKEKYEIERLRVMELETTKAGITSQLTFARMELEQTKQSLLTMTQTLDDERRDRRMEKDDLLRKLDRDLEEQKRRLQETHEAAIKTYRDTVEAAEKAHKDALDSIERKYRQQLDDERTAKAREINEALTQAALEKQKLETKMDSKWREIRQMKEELETVNAALERERLLNASLRDSIAETASTHLSMEANYRALNAKVALLETDAKEKLERMLEAEERTRRAEEEMMVTKEKLRNEESLRRKLHNQVQELKGNIRVFCRVRPPLGTEAVNAADIKFPDLERDAREIEVNTQEKTALGNAISKAHPFQFDRVFGPSCQNQDVFEEISQLVQSALDGYNVCIFCYGQTGSGKTFTMSSKDGMIPRAVHQIYDTATKLEEKGWKYTMEGSFIEVYNENLNDLLGRPDDIDKKKHEIRHDAKELKTTITGLTTVLLDTPSKVEQILRTADTNRSVAATKANERSSRSHSVFMLKLKGENRVTGEKSEGTLNLVDLAGSERLSHSQASGERLKETQSINRSLACLGDVIGALGSGKEGAHIPYRNSKLTYLLQYSLGGNSKTLMFVMISPLQAHLSESLTSLKFATKVSNTYIGTARKKVTGGNQ
ncbi:P-loop containing nucleoside triphosphate hydrolase protein [Kalaharituber pfeilii]|nr:P-loop containing nucleoside triphosphate hydrolase protein [Kalaharituber pfeilii]